MAADPGDVTESEPLELMDSDVVEKPHDWLAVLRDLNVVSEKQHKEWLQGLDILASARTQADKIIADARDEAARIKPAEEEARIPQAVGPPAEETADKTAEVNVLWTRIGKKVEEELDRNRSIVLYYAKKLAASVVEESLQRPEIFERHLANLAYAQTSACLSVIVHPQSMGLVEQAQKQIEALKAAKLEKDRTLGPGDLKLRYSDGDRVCRIGEQLEIRLRKITEEERQNGDGSALRP